MIQTQSKKAPVHGRIAVEKSDNQSWYDETENKGFWLPEKKMKENSMTKMPTS